MEPFSQEISHEILSELGPLILLKSNIPEFSIFCALKIGMQHPSWCQTTSTGLVWSTSIIFIENIGTFLWATLYNYIRSINI